jgi:hypothetical protein
MSIEILTLVSFSFEEREGNVYRELHQADILSSTPLYCKILLEIVLLSKFNFMCKSVQISKYFFCYHTSDYLTNG